MKIANYQWIAALIAVHPNRELKGRVRLQKTIKLLQRLGFPTDYDYTSYFYGPYSESVHADIGLLKNLGLIQEHVHTRLDGNPSYSYTAPSDAEIDEIEPYKEFIEKISRADPIVLELAATYDSYREMGLRHEEALQFLRRKKSSKCADDKDREAFVFLQELDLLDSNESFN